MNSNSRLNTYNKRNPEFRPRHILLKLEEIEPRLIYAFTVNPQMQFFEHTNRLLLMEDHIKAILQSKYATYELYTELSPEGRLHFHGYIRVMDPFRWLLLDINRITSEMTVAMKPLNDVDEWDFYICKQREITQRKAIYIPIEKDLGRETKSYLSTANRTKDIFKESFFAGYREPSNSSV